MGFRDDSRAQSVVIGSLLVFAILIISFSTYQAYLVPNQNAQVEFNHYSEIQDDMQELREAHQQTVTDGKPRSPALRLGTRYSERILAVNPPAPQGTIESESIGSYEINNAPVSPSGDPVTTEGVCGVSKPSTDAIRYVPSYNRLSDGEAGPIVYENTVLYRQMGDNVTILDSGQFLIQGSNINFLPVQGEAPQSSQSISFDMASEGYGVEKELQPNAAPTVVVPTSLSESKWEELLVPSQNVDRNNITKTGDTVEITLNSLDDDSWTVRCASTATSGTSPVDPPEDPGPDRFGRGGVTEHTDDRRTDTVVTPNGLWTDVDQIAEIRFGGSETTSVTDESRNTINNGGENGVTSMFKFEDGTSDNVVYARVNAIKDQGSWQDKEVHLGTNPDNNMQSLELTAEAAKTIQEDGQTDILNPDNYISPGSGGDFDRQDGNFGAYVDDLEQMNDATIQTVDIQGRLEMEVRTGAISLDIASEDRSQTYVYKETSEIEFDVTATGTTENENIDLEITDSQGQEVDPLADRETITIDESTESKDITLTWEPDWNNLNSGQTYEAVVTSEDDEEVATVDIIQQGNAYFDLSITNTTSPVDYSETLYVGVKVENIGDVSGDAQPSISVAGQDGNGGNQKTIDPGETKTWNISYDTSNVDTSNTGELDLTAKACNNGDTKCKETQKVRVENPEIILDPSATDLPDSGDDNTQTINFTLGKDLDGTIKIDLTDTGDAVSYDTDSSDWTIVDGDGQINLNTNNNQVQSVKYQTGSGDSKDDTIRLEATNVNTDDADEGNIYDLNYRVTSANNYPEGSNGDTNTTSFEIYSTPLPANAVAFDDSDGDGAYDKGETTYTENELTGNQVNIKNADLIIDDDIAAGGDKIDLDTNSLTVRPGVELSTTGNRQIDFDIDSYVNISGATLDSGKDITITAAKTSSADIIATDSIIRFGGKAEASAQKGGTLFVNNNGGDRTDGGTYIEKQDGTKADLDLKNGVLDGEAEYGSVSD